MKRMSLKSILVAFAIVVTVWSCKKKDPIDETEPPKAKYEESSSVRILTSETDSKEIQLIDVGDKEKNKTFTVNYNSPAIYATSSKRFAVIVHRADNQLQFLDTRIEAHGDHAHLLGDPRLIEKVHACEMPTHFYTLGNRIAIFNDGDGSVTKFTENSISSPFFSPNNISIGNQAHHGVVVPFLSGNFMASVKIEGEGALPQKVAIFNADGTVKHELETTVTSIHGDAGNGTWAVIGATEGVIAVKEDGTEKLIPNSSDLNTESGNWLGTLIGHIDLPVLYGRARNKGVFLVNPDNDEIKPVLKSDQVSQVIMCPKGKDLFVLMNDGTLHVYNALTGMNKGTFSNVSTTKTDTNVPKLGATSKYLYVTEPDAKKINVYDRNNYSRVHTFDLDKSPASITILGWFE